MRRAPPERHKALTDDPENPQDKATAYGAYRPMISVGGTQYALARKGAWTAEEQAEADQLQAAWTWIKATRAASDVLERDKPADFTADKWWPA